MSWPNVLFFAFTFMAGLVFLFMASSLLLDSWLQFQQHRAKTRPPTHQHTWGKWTVVEGTITQWGRTVDTTFQSRACEGCGFRECKPL